MHGNKCVWRVYRTVRRQVVYGVLPPGTRINESALSRDLRVSRTPLREALNRLAGEGIIGRASPGGGFTCPCLSDTALNRIRQHRAALLSRTAAQATRSAAATHQRPIIRACQRYETLQSAQARPADQLRARHAICMRLIGLTRNGADVAQLNRWNQKLWHSDLAALPFQPQPDLWLTNLALGVAWQDNARISKALAILSDQMAPTDRPISPHFEGF